jgi:hypothetical protein
MEPRTKPITSIAAVSTCKEGIICAGYLVGMAGNLIRCDRGGDAVPMIDPCLFR